jgi:hypothetical protein
MPRRRRLSQPGDGGRSRVVRRRSRQVTPAREAGWKASAPSQPTIGWVLDLVERRHGAALLLPAGADRQRIAGRLDARAEPRRLVPLMSRSIDTLIGTGLPPLARGRLWSCAPYCRGCRRPFADLTPRALCPEGTVQGRSSGWRICTTSR